MNLLAVDIGNTDIKFGLFQDGRLKRQWRATDTRASSAIFADALRDRLCREMAGEPCEALAYACVVPEAETVFLEICRQCLNVPESRIFAVDTFQDAWPVDFTPYPPDQLGMDRMVNVCAAGLLYPGKPLAVMDFGTATTLDLISGDARYKGGAIAPGLRTFMTCLSQRTARLFPVDLAPHTPETLSMGFDTRSCLEAGLGIGYRGLVNGLLDAAEALYPPEGPPMLIATGGLADSVIRLCGLESRFAVIDPALTLKGLDQLYYRAVPANAEMGITDAGTTH